MGSPELYTGQGIQALQKPVLKRYKMIEEIIRRDEPGEKLHEQY